jgi:hypothetical protein
MPGKPDDSYMPDGLETPTTGGSVTNVQDLAKSILERSGAQVVWESKSRDVLRVRYSEADDNACFACFALNMSLTFPLTPLLDNFPFPSFPKATTNPNATF